MNKFRRGLLLLGLLFVRPREFWDRLYTLVEAKWERRNLARGEGPKYSNRITFQEAVRRFSEIYQTDLDQLMQEEEFQDLNGWVEKKTEELRSDPARPFPLYYSADGSLMISSYIFSKVLKPKIVIETGVAYGVTTETILTALHGNGSGKLYSIELPPLGDRPANTYIGSMVRPEHRSGWNLSLGSSRQHLPRLFANGREPAGLFLHDSPSVYALERFEMNFIWQHLTDNGVMIMNMIENNSAFQEFAEDKKDCEVLVIEQVDKPGSLTGVIIRHG